VKNYKLILGDTITIALVTVIGFITHGEADISFAPRMLAAFIPLTIAWFLLAPVFGLFEENVVLQPRQLWRAVWCALFAAPFAGVLRGLWLGADIPPSFIVAFGATSALGLVIWRGIYLYVVRK